MTFQQPELQGAGMEVGLPAGNGHAHLGPQNGRYHCLNVFMTCPGTCWAAEHRMAPWKGWVESLGCLGVFGDCAWKVLDAQICCVTGSGLLTLSGPMHSLQETTSMAIWPKHCKSPMSGIKFQILQRETVCASTGSVPQYLQRPEGWGAQCLSP